jgi:hypothetical protein
LNSVISQNHTICLISDCHFDFNISDIDIVIFLEYRSQEQSQVVGLVDRLAATTDPRPTVLKLDFDAIRGLIEVELLLP